MMIAAITVAMQKIPAVKEKAHAVTMMVVPIIIFSNVDIVVRMHRCSLLFCFPVTLISSQVLTIVVPGGSSNF